MDLGAGLAPGGSELARLVLLVEHEVVTGPAPAAGPVLLHAPDQAADGHDQDQEGHHPQEPRGVLGGVQASLVLGEVVCRDQDSI